MKYRWILCQCGKDIHPLDMPRHFQSKHEWPNEDTCTTKSDSETADETGSGAEATA
jgi:hypothetical protein